jgi:hypothetical protein
MTLAGQMIAYSVTTLAVQHHRVVTITDAPSSKTLTLSNIVSNLHFSKSHNCPRATRIEDPSATQPAPRQTIALDHCAFDFISLSPRGKLRRTPSQVTDSPRLRRLQWHFTKPDPQRIATTPWFLSPQI